ncbi:hypothetical protein BGX34_009226 [Mortierella sp. NVP85]|nr:hypothetical protein BGX34_009226 [Mortierella sp. NVP85]
MLCFSISEQEIENALSKAKAAFCNSTTAADKSADLEQCVKALKIAVGTLAKIKKDGKRALNKDQNINLRKEIVDAYVELTQLQSYSGPDKAQKCFEFATKWRNGVNTPEPIQPQPQLPIHENDRSVDCASISSGGTHSIPDQFYQASLASRSSGIAAHDEENPGGNTPGSSDVALDVSRIDEPIDNPSDGSLRHPTKPREQYGKHTGCFADAAPRIEHHAEEIVMSQSKQPEDDEPLGNKEDKPVDHQPADESPEKEPTERIQTEDPPIHPRLLELYEVTDKVLGEGTFATVKEIKLKSTGQSFALKIILKKNLKGKIGMLDTEIAILSKVRHPNCISLLEMFETEDAVYLVTELASGGELFDQLLKKGYYTEVDAARLIREILLGVEYLHSMDIVHRDLKPENLLFLDKSENARLMITDFGLSKVLTNGDDVLMTACGTPGYVAPEVLEQIGHGKPVDMWSIGIIAYTLLCGYTPFWGEDQATLFGNIIAGHYEYDDEYWKDISPLAKAFIDRLLVRPAEKRATATQALADPWFNAMLDQDPAISSSPAESVNLLPGVRKNMNTGNVFKKAVRAVGILRRIQMLSGGGVRSAAIPSSKPGVQDSVAVQAVGTPDEARSNPVHQSFADVVNAAMIDGQGSKGANTLPIEEQ